jgi:(2Fe-2S) ferredoxin
MGQRLVYVCEGGDCSEKGSVELFEKLRARLHAIDPNEEKVRVRKYPCFGGCEHGINITVWPDRVFYSQVKEGDLDDVVEHIEKEGPKVARLCGKVKPDVEAIVWQMLESPF